MSIVWMILLGLAVWVGLNILLVALWIAIHEIVWRSPQYSSQRWRQHS
jgi:hypothetical protein